MNVMDASLALVQKGEAELRKRSVPVMGREVFPEEHPRPKIRYDVRGMGYAMNASIQEGRDCFLAYWCLATRLKMSLDNS